MIVVEQRRGVLSGSIAVSLLLHVVGIGLLFSYGSMGGGMSRSPAVNEQLVMPVEREDELRLGIDAARSASIDWLGVQEPEPVVGEAAISETDQAAQAVVVGEMEEVVAELVEPVEAIEEMVDAVDEVKPVEEVVEAVLPVEDLVVDEGDGVVIAEAVSEPVETAEERESEPVEAVEQSQEAKKPVVPTPAPVPAGDRGVLSQKEVVATRKERAIDVDPRKPNTPVVGEGLEIITVRPRYTSAVRLSAVPKNPIVVMWFDAEGKVSKAEFLREGKRLYSSGVVGVDEPLMNAIYRWRAKGKRIDALDAEDPKSLVEVSIKIVYQKERKGSSD